MSYSQYIANVEAWKKYFKQPTKEHKRIYTIPNSSQHGEKLSPIKLVSPTEQILEQAKSSLKRMKEEDYAQQFIPSPAKPKRKRIKNKKFPIKKLGGVKKNKKGKKKK